nr:pleiotropic drug resistance protein 2-like [Ipomoea batatas]
MKGEHMLDPGRTLPTLFNAYNEYDKRMTLLLGSSPLWENNIFEGTFWQYCDKDLRDWLGLDICADIIWCGNENDEGHIRWDRRSVGQYRRNDSSGPAKVFFWYESLQVFSAKILGLLPLHQMALSLLPFYCLHLEEHKLVCQHLGLFSLLVVFVLVVSFVAKGTMTLNISVDEMGILRVFPCLIGQNAIAINEFLDKDGALSIQLAWCFLKSRSMPMETLNLLFVMRKIPNRIDMAVRHSGRGLSSEQKRGMVLPFQPLSLAFNHVNYYVDMPAEMQKQGIEETRLQLLQDVSGAFRPGVLTALVGVSGAGKTTLMDVLAGRKTSGYIEGSINISGYPKNQSTFARISGYCEQNDIHSPHVTVYESLVYSAWLRLSPDVDKQTRKMFIEEVMELVELNPLRDSLVGLPGVDGLSTEQRKRLTIAVELVANPSIIFMDEPTSGLDARAAAIVMRTVRNTVDTGRTVVCTIHQPSIDIFEAFDELLLMKRGGQVIYAGPLGHHSHRLIQYFENLCHLISTGRNQELIEQLSTSPGQDLHFPKYPTFITQCHAALENAFHTGGIHSTMQIRSKHKTVESYGSYVFCLFCSSRTNTNAVQSVVSVGIEAVYIAIQTLIYSILLYFMIGFEWGADRFFWFYYYIFMCFLYFTSYGMMLVALTPSYQISAIVMTFFLSFWNLFSGFLIPRTQIPVWWRWYYWGSPVAWTIYGLITSQIGDKTDLVAIPGAPDMKVKDYLKENLGFDMTSLV